MVRMSSFVVAIAVAKIVVILSASSPIQAAPAPAPLPIAKAPAEVRPAIAHADAIFTSIRSAHLVELTSAIAAGGASGAIGICHQAAAQIVERTKRTEGIALGRTSDRLRNPTNAPPAWAVPIITRFAGARASQVDGFYVDLGDHVGVIRPVAEIAICAGCHGPADRLDPAVRKILKDRYPADHAVGFREGEIRGWLWAEVPK